MSPTRTGLGRTGSIFDLRFESGGQQVQVGLSDGAYFQNRESGLAITKCRVASPGTKCDPNYLLMKGKAMRLYYHPASTTSRMIKLFASEEGIDLDYKVVDLSPLFPS